MPNPSLNSSQLESVNAFLAKLRHDIEVLSGGMPELQFAFRRKICKELSYDERGNPTQRKKLKHLMWEKQDGRCGLCNEILAEKYSELDRFQAIDGYVETNVRLVHHECHIDDQAKKKYT